MNSFLFKGQVICIAVPTVRLSKSVSTKQRPQWFHFELVRERAVRRLVGS